MTENVTTWRELSDLLTADDIELLVVLETLHEYTNGGNRRGCLGLARGRINERLAALI